MTAAPVHPIRDLAFLADGERGALVDPQGEVQWMCFPRWHDEPLLRTLFGRPGGYTVRPADRFTWGGYYEEGTLIWRSRWTLDTGAIVESQEALALPGDRERAFLLRRVVGVAGRARMEARLSLAAGWQGDGTLLPPELLEPGTWRWKGSRRWARWQCGPGARPEGDGLSLTFDIQEGEQRDLVLELSTSEPAARLAPASVLWEATRRGWQEAVPPLDRAGGTRESRQSYAVLRGLTSSSSGLLASCTTSLPERIDSGRVYDYRYVWIRDQVYAGCAGAALGGGDLLENATRFVTDRLLEDGAALRPAYTVDGDEVPSERRVEIPGYPGGCPVTVGNRAGGQFQLDCFGEALTLIAQAVRHDVVDRRGIEAAGIAARAIEERWNERDAGVWELQPRWWAHSRLVCAAGLRAIAAVHQGRESGDWATLADRLVTDAARRCLRDGRWWRAEEDDRVDAALLLATIRGALSVDDPRARSLLEAVREHLAHDAFCWRFRSGERLGEGEGAFTLCGFWMALALLERGERVDAVRWFERAASTVGTAGLFSEEYDPVQRQQRGNVPQAFVHAGFLEAAARLTSRF